MTSITPASGQVENFTYDINGNMTSDGARTYTWNAKNELLSVTAGPVVTSFTYDHSGNRVTKSTSNGALTYVTPNYEIEDTSASRTVRNFVYDGADLVATLETVTPSGGSPAPAIFYTHTDHLGTSSVATNVAGAVTQEFDNFPFGETRAEVLRTGTGTPKKFTGKELDEETGLYYYGARYYSPRIGRFVSLDPASVYVKDPRSFVNPQGWNAYSYAVNNPMRFIDPTGEFYENFNMRNWGWQAIANQMQAGTDAMRSTGDFITFGHFTEAIDRASTAGQQINNEGLNVNTATNALKEVGTGSFKLIVVSTGTGMTLGEIQQYFLSLTGLKMLEGEAEKGITNVQKSTTVIPPGNKLPSNWGNPTTLNGHFKSHGSDFGAKTAQEYANMGSDFLRRSQQQGIPTKVDQAGVIRVYDTSTNTFGSYNPNGTTRTFFKPGSGASYWNQQPGNIY